MILKIDETEGIRVNYVREVITFQNSTPEAEVRIDIEGNCLQELEDRLFTSDCSSIVLYADDDSELANYNEYGLSNLEQSIQDDIVITTVVLRNIREEEAEPEM